MNQVIYPILDHCDSFFHDVILHFVKRKRGHRNVLLRDNKYEKNFLLLCGFEKFREFYVRIDILEKLFLKIIENTKDKKFKTNAEMMNLLGCSKENFYKLINYMDYKKDKTEDTYIFLGEKKKKKKIIRFDKKENPFKKLLSLNLNK